MTRPDDPVTQYDLDRIRADFVDRMSVQDMRINQSLNEATECVVEAKDAARQAQNAGKAAAEAQRETKEVAKEVRGLLVEFRESVREQTIRLQQGQKTFEEMQGWMKNKAEECKGHQMQTAILGERLTLAKQWTPAAVASLVSGLVVGVAAWIIKG